MARVICKKGLEAKAKYPQLVRGEVLTCLESLGYDPKPDDLALGRMKQR